MACTSPEPDGEITAIRLERALAIVAEIATRPGGDVYLPIFLRLETELAALSERDAARERARARVAKSASASGQAAAAQHPPNDQKMLMKTQPDL